MLNLENDDALKPTEQLKLVFEVMTLALMEGVGTLLKMISDPGEDLSIQRFENDVDPSLHMMAEIRRERALQAREHYLARLDMCHGA